MEFAILGPLRASVPRGRSRSRRPSSGRCWRCCCSSPGRTWSPPERLIDVLWGEHPPATASSVAGPDLAAAAHARRRHDRDPLGRVRDRARRRRPGPPALRALVAKARDADPARAAALLRDALALFRGAPLADAPLWAPAVSRPTGSRARPPRGARAAHLARSRARPPRRGRERARGPAAEHATASGCTPSSCSRTTARGDRPTRWRPISARGCAGRGSRAGPEPGAQAPGGGDPVPRPGARARRAQRGPAAAVVRARSAAASAYATARP